jgi:hypothetical protein
MFLGLFQAGKIKERVVVAMVRSSIHDIVFIAILIFVHTA